MISIQTRWLLDAFFGINITFNILSLFAGSDALDKCNIWETLRWEKTNISCAEVSHDTTICRNASSNYWEVPFCVTPAPFKMAANCHVNGSGRYSISLLRTGLKDVTFLTVINIPTNFVFTIHTAHWFQPLIQNTSESFSTDFWYKFVIYIT